MHKKDHNPILKRPNKKTDLLIENPRYKGANTLNKVVI